MSWLKHAFAIDPPGAAEPTEDQKPVVEKVCQEVIRRRMATPALIMLETFRPLNFVGSQVLHFFHPIVSAILTTEAYKHFTEFLERRGSVDYLCQRIEQLDDEMRKKNKKSKTEESAPTQKVTKDG
ncbi:MAG: hypothetical protein QF923_04840 [Candidatus Marinimicrobia bacterium]|jgi:hypothetical protein|nr:hypothetical protein [Candidatus Neomarinimicrobiota bacterium]MDP7653782.1 hypothetical protein [Candidatus Neomarinimicrobiota bacterium]|tara:strand:- start:6272 stop:6649 length:378 start_codon:yes stop_codon:yes gene_type:complete